jgi:hypothetical protein
VQVRLQVSKVLRIEQISEFGYETTVVTGEERERRKRVRRHAANV